MSFLGEKPRELLPNYLKAFDVAIMSYDLNSHVLTNYPLKFHEYLAGAKPIVSVNIPELEPFRNVIYISQNAEEFLSNIRFAIKENTSDKVQKRIEVARQNTWDKRVEEISCLIESKSITTKNEIS